MLGDTGVNFGAGMTGGFAFVLDLKSSLEERCNSEFVDIRVIDSGSAGPHRRLLQATLRDFIAETDSHWARSILDSFADYIGKFRVVKPRSLEFDRLVESLESAA